MYLSLHLNQNLNTMKHSTILGAIGIALICDILLIGSCCIWWKNILAFFTNFGDICTNTLAVCLSVLAIIIIISIVLWILYKFINFNENRK